MSNRAQRRKLQNDPRVKGFVDKFAIEMSRLFVETIESNTDKLRAGKEANFELSEEQKQMFKNKGKELGNYMQSILNQNNESPNKIRVNIGNKSMEL